MSVKALPQSIILRARVRVWMCKITHKHALARRDDKKTWREKKGKQAQTSCRHCLVATQETISEATENKTEGDNI